MIRIRAREQRYRGWDATAESGGSNPTDRDIRGHPCQPRRHQACCISVLSATHGAARNKVRRTHAQSSAQCGLWVARARRPGWIKSGMSTSRTSAHGHVVWRSYPMLSSAEEAVFVFAWGTGRGFGRFYTCYSIDRVSVAMPSR